MGRRSGSLGGEEFRVLVAKTSGSDYLSVFLMLFHDFAKREYTKVEK